MKLDGRCTISCKGKMVNAKQYTVLRNNTLLFLTVNLPFFVGRPKRGLGRKAKHLSKLPDKVF